MKNLLFLSLFLTWAICLPTAFSTVASATTQITPLSYQAKVETGQVTFKAIGRPSALKIVGEGPAPQGQLSLDSKGNLTGTFEFELSTLDTGIGLRDRHMKEKYLEVGKFPKATLMLTTMKLPDAMRNTDGTQQGVPFQGTLTVRNIKKLVKGSAELIKTHTKLEANAMIRIQVKDFNIDVPSYAGITMANDVDILVSIGGKLTPTNKKEK